MKQLSGLYMFLIVALAALCTGLFPAKTFASGTGTTLVQSVSLTAPKRNNFSGYVGMRFTTGSTGVTVSELGRWVIAGNSQSHQLELVDASTGSVVAATTLTTAGLPAGFAYASLSSPVTLSANHSYYLVSLETSGGDYWYDNSETVTPTTLVASIDHGEYSSNNSTWYPGGLANNAYVPTDLIGTTGSTISAPTASLSANPTSITSGQSSTLSWSSTNATACTGAGFSTGNAVSGSVSVTPATTTTYSVTCTNGSTSATAGATVAVTATGPTATLSANPTSITSGQSSTLSWSSANTTSCTGTGFSTGNAVSGSVGVTPATTTIYSVTCTNGSTSATAGTSVAVNVPAPTATLSANPTSVTSGQTSTLSWSSANATSCTGTGFSTGNAVSGSVSVKPATTTTYLVSCTNGSTSATASVTVAGPAATASTDVFAGPFSSWLNVVTGYGADPTGAADSTTAIQNALTAAGSSGKTVYLPAGTYKISSTLKTSAVTGLTILGHSSSDTTISWAGTSGGTMLATAGLNYGVEGRITWNGNSTAGAIIFSDSTSGSSSGIFHHDSIYENAAYGIRLGSGTTDDAERFILRCTFQHLTTAGVSLESNNVLDIWVWNGTFTNDVRGMTAPAANEGGGQLYFSNFSGNTIDYYTAGTPQGIVAWGNYSSGSGQFLSQAKCGGDADYTVVQDNTIVGTTNGTSPINTACAGAGLLALNNQISTSVSPAITHTGGGSTIAINNLFTASSGGITSPSGRQVEINSTYSGTVSRGANTITAPTVLTGHSQDVTTGSGCGTSLAAAIAAAVTYEGSRPVVHIPAGTCNVASTITVPPNLDVVLVGDGYGTNVNWTGGSGGAVFQLSSPGKAHIQNLRITTSNNADGILVGTEDSAGSYVNAHFLVEQNSTQGVYIEPLANTRVNFYGLDGYNSSSSTSAFMNVAGTGSASNSTTAVFCGTISSAGANPIFTTSRNPNLVVRDVWSEKNSFWGTFTGGNISFAGGQFAPTVTSTYMITLSAYSGKFTMLNWNFATGGASAGSIQITGSTSSTNVLYSMDWCRSTCLGSGAGTGGQVYGFEMWSGSSPAPISDYGGTPSNAFITTMLNQLMTVEPMPNTATASGVTAVDIQNVFMQAPANGIHVKTGI